MTTLLVDGNNLYKRSEFAAGNIHLSARGSSTGTLLLFVNQLSKYVREVGPDRMAVYWDAGHTMRDEIYPAYKAARREKPAEPSHDLGQVFDFLLCAGITQAASDGWEADDLIAVAARQSDDDVVILSGDKDLLQLVRDADNLHGHGATTQMRFPTTEVWDEEKVHQKFGVYPRDLPAYLALVGDVSDGIPGVAGIGPKKALKVLAEAEGDWEAVLAALGPEKAPTAVQMRSLVDLRTLDYPDEIWSVYAEVPPFQPVCPTTSASRHWDTLRQFCQRYELAEVLTGLETGRIWRTERVAEDFFDGV